MADRLVPPVAQPARGALATLISLALGLWLAYLLANRKFRGKELLDAVATLPLVLPPTVLGYYLLVVLGPRKSRSAALYEAIFGHAAGLHLAGGAWWRATIPRVSAAGEDRRARRLKAWTAVYEKAARNLGASEWRVFWRVTLPLARRSIFAAAVLAFARSLGDFGVTLMIAGNIPGPDADRRRRHLRRRGIGQHARWRACWCW